MWKGEPFVSEMLMHLTNQDNLVLCYQLMSMWLTQNQTCPSDPSNIYANPNQTIHTFDDINECQTEIALTRQ
jgi:hypothetical protein